MNWLWLNIPLGSLIFLAVAGIPVWLVIKRSDTRPDSVPAGRAAQQPALVPVYAASPSRPPAGGQRQAEAGRWADVLVSAR